MTTEEFDRYIIRSLAQKAREWIVRGNLNYAGDCLYLIERYQFNKPPSYAHKIMMAQLGIPSDFLEKYTDNEITKS